MASALLRSRFALGAGAALIIGGRALLERRRGGTSESGDAGEPGGGGGKDADLGTELRGAASGIAVSLLDRATAKLES